MRLSKSQFDEKLRGNQLTLSFIGMSNIGKTFLSKKLTEIGFRHINCDNLIEAGLAPILKNLGYAGLADVSRWMGQPYDERYPANQQKYLELEKTVMKNILTPTNIEKQNTVIDTTGSVVHTGEDICGELRKKSLVVYIEASQNMKEKMFKNYVKKPKPVVFGDVYAPKGAESAKQALERCYRNLLDWRSALYAKYADVRIPYGGMKKNMDAGQIISLIRRSL